VAHYAAGSAERLAQLEACLDGWFEERLWGQALYSTYGPTADTGGLFQNKAQVIYRYGSIEDLLAREADGGDHPPLPGPGASSPTERP
jgi:hypothetical protein